MRLERALREYNETYGKNEEYLIRHFNLGQFIDKKVSIDRPRLFIMMIENAFLRNEQSPETDALRRVFNHFKSNKPCESEEAFDELWRIDKMTDMNEKDCNGISKAEYLEKLKSMNTNDELTIQWFSESGGLVTRVEDGWLLTECSYGDIANSELFQEEYQLIYLINDVFSWT